VTDNLPVLFIVILLAIASLVVLLFFGDSIFGLPAS
jgi:hypothetical protein